jgi:hypothetical protein
VRDQGIKQQLLLRGSKTLSKALRQTLGLEIAKLTVTSSIRPWKTSVRSLLRSQPTHKQKKRLPVAYMLAV